MSDEGRSPPVPLGLAKPRATRRRGWVPSLIWLIPLVAALIGITLVSQILLDRGPKIEVSFKTADGLEAGKTVFKYKDVQIGVVQSLRLTKDRSRVRVVLELSKDVLVLPALGGQQYDLGLMPHTSLAAPRQSTLVEQQHPVRSSGDCRSRSPRWRWPWIGEALAQRTHGHALSDADGTRRAARPDRRAGIGRRRLPHQAYSDGGAGGPRASTDAVPGDATGLDAGV